MFDLTKEQLEIVKQIREGWTKKQEKNRRFGLVCHNSPTGIRGWNMVCDVPQVKIAKRRKVIPDDPVHFDSPYWMTDP
jgi:hypothetical protein